MNIRAMAPVTVVKLGGSAITDKSKECTPDLRVIQDCTHQLARFAKPLVILHGGGSFAHPIVTRAHLQEGYKKKSQLNVITETELYLDQLTRIIGVSLLRNDKPFVGLRPMSFVSLKNGEVGRVFLPPLKAALNLGLTPLIHGDLVFDSVRGISVLSADRIASLLGVRLRASRVLFGCDVDGVFSEDPRNSGNARLVKMVSEKNAQSVFRGIESARSSDATGGMSGKVREAIRLAQHGVESRVFNLRKEGLLEEALLGRISIGTVFLPWGMKFPARKLALWHGPRNRIE